MFDLVIATELHLTYAGARLHTNNTAEITSSVEALHPWSMLLTYNCCSEPS